MQRSWPLYHTIKDSAYQDDICNPLIHIATDGEIYGHHEPYGDMCLAALIKKIDNDTKSKFKEVFDQINKNLEYFFPKIFGGYSGTIVDNLGYEVFFLITALIGVPVLFLVWFAGKYLEMEK